MSASIEQRAKSICFKSLMVLGTLLIIESKFDLDYYLLYIVGAAIGLIGLFRLWDYYFPKTK